MPLDIQAFRTDQGGDIAKLIESQRRRVQPDIDKPEPNLAKQQIEAVVAIDNEWRRATGGLDAKRTEAGKLQKQVGKLRKAKQNADELQAQVKDLKMAMKNEEEKLVQLTVERNQTLAAIGNFVHDSVPVSHDEEKNAVLATWGNIKGESEADFELQHHHEILYRIGGYEPERGAAVAGHRGYFLTGPGVQLNMALQNYGVSFLNERGYMPVQPPYMMNKEVMAETAQLSQFDEELYHVTGEQYLIATSEQPLSAMHRKEWLHKKDLPIKYAGVSTCFRKEAGAHGKDAWGIFRVHQFEKIEQFILCDPEESWDMHKEMVKTAEAFYQSLKLPYRVVNIVSGELNNAAAMKHDLEAWFPTLRRYRELVSCSNCTDYQSRAMGTRFGNKNMNDREKKYVHMLNGTLTATTRTICCILENYQTADGVKIPDVLQPFFGRKDFLPFVRELPKSMANSKHGTATKRKQKEAAKKAASEKK